jgi:hypothetical protein
MMRSNRHMLFDEDIEKLTSKRGYERRDYCSCDHS